MSTVRSRVIPDSSHTFAQLANVPSGHPIDLQTPDGGLVSLTPFGGDALYAQVLYREHLAGPVVDARVLLPEELAVFADEKLPLNHVWANASRSSSGTRGTPEELKAAVAAEMARDPSEADPSATAPDQVQSPGEAQVANHLDTPQAVQASVQDILGVNGPKVPVGGMVQSEYLDAAKTLLTSQNVYQVNPLGQAIPHTQTQIFYDAQHRPTLVTVNTLQSYKLEVFGEILLEHSMRSTSLIAGFVLAIGSPGGISSGSALGDLVFRLGKALTDSLGASVTFNLAYQKTRQRLRLEGSFNFLLEIGPVLSTITPIPQV